ncbi:hypothetical protein RB628_25580 [Streptomyces sp. ADMS]|uniref:hypothetical protein n=1 Tax=Streptomyces sp. ADMS TaxID=3071415 RepID=UPI00296F5F1B|nr:hypothetical protein [Streptomyces sp. ADMS]MDW4908617.1 hypothetical protein [Streptomyces sp. ADMS]
MIAAVGHADLASDTLKLVEPGLRAVLERLSGGVPGLVRAGAGASLAFGRAMRAADRELVVVIPTQAMVPALLPERDRLAVGELLCLARQVRLLAYDPGHRDACVGADEVLIEGCERMVAVWDGSPSNGRDATAHLVAESSAAALGTVPSPFRQFGPLSEGPVGHTGGRLALLGRAMGTERPMRAASVRVSMESTNCSGRKEITLRRTRRDGSRGW